MAGKRITQTEIQADSGVHVETLRRLFYGTGTFEAKTLESVARAIGVSRWESIVALGHRATTLGLPPEIEETRRREAEGASDG